MHLWGKNCLVTMQLYLFKKVKLKFIQDTLISPIQNKQKEQIS